MKRSKQLQPLSREHHLGLVISRHAKECENNANDIAKHWTALIDYISQNMTNHFKVEDNLMLVKLMPFKEGHSELAEVIQNITEQHNKLYHALNIHNPNVEQVRELGSVLYDHIRYEERVLFPLAEQILSKHELDAIYAASSQNVKR